MGVDWPAWYTFTDYQGPWYMSEWAWATVVCLWALWLLRKPKRPSRPR